MYVCDQCNGSGWIVVDDMTRSKCVCAYAREMKAHLGTDIAMATPLESSPLYVDKDHDLTLSNLFIKVADYPALLPHLKWVLTNKGPAFKFKRITDDELKAVWVGDMSYAMRSKSKRDDVETYNCLADLIGAHVHLAIIRLGIVRKNVRLPEIILEALMLRDALALSTWIVEVAETPFGYGAPSYSPETARYIEENFEVLTIRATRQAPPPQKVETHVEDVSLDDAPAPPPRAVAAESHFKEASRADYSQIETTPRRKSGGWRPKKPSGGGPLGGLL